jgi:peptidoglycan/LPS O-acetylase OafA/YrhL
VLRFVVASMIVLYHFRMAAPLPLPELHPVFERGYLLTNFFIIDSGYVLARTYSEKLATQAIPLGDFYRQRFLRVVPAHLIVSLALAALVITTAAFGKSPPMLGIRLGRNPLHGI